MLFLTLNQQCQNSEGNFYARRRLLVKQPTSHIEIVFSPFSALTLLVGWQEGHPACKKTNWWDAGVVICLERGADLNMAQLMPLPLIVSCFSKIQIGFTCLVPADLGSPGKRAVKRVYVCMYIGCWCWIVYIEPFHIQVMQPCKQPTMALLFHIYFVVYYFLIDL